MYRGRFSNHADGASGTEGSSGNPFPIRPSAVQSDPEWGDITCADLLSSGGQPILAPLIGMPLTESIMENQQPTRINVAKAEMALAKDESVNEFSRKLRAVLQKKIVEHFALGERSWVYVCDIFDTDAVVEVERRTEASGRELYQVPYKRAADGTFSFGAPVPVIRRVTYVPKTTKVEKSTALFAGLLETHTAL